MRNEPALLTEGLVALIIFLLCGYALAHDINHPELDQWYGSLRRPGVEPNNAFGIATCCGQTDCHPTESELRGKEWWARIGVRRADGDWDLKDWVKVPAEVVLQHQGNLAGEGVLCHSTVWRSADGGQVLDPRRVTIWCFVPPAEI